MGEAKRRGTHEERVAAATATSTRKRKLSKRQLRQIVDAEIWRYATECMVAAFGAHVKDNP